MYTARHHLPATQSHAHIYVESQVMHTSNIALMSDNRAANYNASCNVLIDAIDVNTLGSILITCMTEAAYQMHIT